MYLAPFTIDGVVYKSSEHYYQCRKVKNSTDADFIRQATTGYQAKERAHSLSKDTLHQYTNQEKLQIMKIAFFAKFSQNPAIKEKLIQTKDAVLCGDILNDSFWGYQKVTNTGENWIGKLIMQVRDELQ
jgi:ribA/ribD-fused uncharacterized protein